MSWWYVCNGIYGDDTGGGDNNAGGLRKWLYVDVLMVMVMDMTEWSSKVAYSHDCTRMIPRGDDISMSEYPEYIYADFYQ